MKIQETRIKDVFLLELEQLADDRGYFARTWCDKEFTETGLEPSRWVQANTSFNTQKGTLRGLHYQRPPCEEPKLVRCTRGAIYDVAVDLRENSESYRKWQAFELSQENGTGIYLPAGIAHGFQTLEDNTEVTYLMGEFYKPDAQAGYRYDDPTFAISWPLAVIAISEKDLALGQFNDA